MPDVVLVTGGTGLVGKGIDYIINTEPEGSRFGKKPGETWIFASSSEGDLRSVYSLKNPLGHDCNDFATTEILSGRVVCMISISLLMSSILRRSVCDLI